MSAAVALTPEVLRKAFGCFPSGVVAVAALVDDVPVGMAASSFTSVSLDPPLVSVSIAQSSATWPLLRRAARLGVSVLAAHHAALCRQLSGPAAHRFAGVQWEQRTSGAVLMADAAAMFECSVADEVAAGDHLIALLRLHEVDDGSAPPLVFHRSRLVPLG